MKQLSMWIDGAMFAKPDPQQQEDHLLYTFPPAPEGAETIEIILHEAKCGDEGYYAVPYVNISFLTKFLPRADADFIARESTIMPMLGVRCNGEAWLMIARGMIHDYRVRVRVKDGRYTLSLLYDLTKISLYEPISLAIYELGNADYSAMARRYRKYRMETMNLTPLCDRVDPVMQYALKGMPVIRIRMGWKPVPSPVNEQTIETEPPMHVACTFAQVEELVDEMKAQGIERAEICLVGWNIRGHDGRWPQAFPVEGALGGEEGLRKLIAHTQATGYRIVCHTNASDAYRIADCWDEEDLIRTKQGNLSISAEGWSGGRMYHLCLGLANQKHQIPLLDKIQNLGFGGFHYIDVLSITAPKPCFHPKHPQTSEQYAQNIRTILNEARMRMGGASSEGAFDFCAETLDFALYVGFNVLDHHVPVADEPVPLWQIVYHGYILSNTSAETVNHMVKPARNRLKAYEYGSIPTIYYYSKFVTGNRKNWMGNDDMLFDTPERLKNSVALIKKELDEYREFAPRQLAFMEQHDKLAEGLYRVTYSDGWKVLFNYNTFVCEADGVSIPAEDMVQIPPKN